MKPFIVRAAAVIGDAALVFDTLKEAESRKSLLATERTRQCFRPSLRTKRLASIFNSPGRKKPGF